MPLNRVQAENHRILASPYDMKWTAGHPSIPKDDIMMKSFLARFEINSFGEMSCPASLNVSIIDRSAILQNAADRSYGQLSFLLSTSETGRLST